MAEREGKGWREDVGGRGGKGYVWKRLEGKGAGKEGGRMDHVHGTMGGMDEQAVNRQREEQRDDVRHRLAVWWEVSARDLPWRFGRTTPWGVLVSEVMSQQTQMSRVVPYWTAWMNQWPDARSLAAAAKADVIAAWGRLGYPRRALRLQECAQVVASQYDDVLPRTYDELTALPGIGDYTASAVMSFAFGERIAVIDTNIRRVLSRVFVGEESLGGAASRAERELAWELLPQDAAQSVVWNESVMELGAVVCTAKAPLCESCPIRECCLFLQRGLPGLGLKRTRPRQRFAGTDRMVRGLVMQALRDRRAELLADAGAAAGMGAAASEGGVAQPVLRVVLDADAVRALWKDENQLDRCVASLDEDGLIEMLPDRSIMLPE
ncbi:A/G-specific adenine glycosylase [Bifidobacterium gallicum DSM 20093 = LMG 11596]|uniref:Adenine DNA glycosylase n=1 Tax=Bifidobacterium gallicum DSM 20093 = LMG 11596 TaxID=561180 RepID=A0A087AG22_9BIFI|nr:A/G-specific adenine glycosylase [Bifidobacterium gallicum DSM 20093 = LMG 11596]